MELRVNGKRININKSKLGIPALLAEMGLGDKTQGIAIAVNEEVVAKGRWDALELKEGDVVEIITANAGG